MLLAGIPAFAFDLAEPANGRGHAKHGPATASSLAAMLGAIGLMALNLGDAPVATVSFAVANGRPAHWLGGDVPTFPCPAPVGAAPLLRWFLAIGSHHGSPSAREFLAPERPPELAQTGVDGGIEADC